MDSFLKCPSKLIIKPLTRNIKSEGLKVWESIYDLQIETRRIKPNRRKAVSSPQANPAHGPVPMQSGVSGL